MNEYHGRAASFVRVREGGPRDLRRYKNRALFLCYPPPGDDMAARSIREHGGDVVAVVGEWDGNTGDASLARELRESWNLARRVSLPQWGDTAHELTIWQRRRRARPEGPGRGRDARVRVRGVPHVRDRGPRARVEAMRVLPRGLFLFGKVLVGRRRRAARTPRSTRVRDLAWTAPAYSDEASFRVFRPCGGG